MWIRSITDYDVIIDSFASVLFHVVLRGNDVHTKRNSMTSNNEEYNSLTASDLVKENACWGPLHTTHCCGVKLIKFLINDSRTIPHVNAVSDMVNLVLCSYNSPLKEHRDDFILVV